MFVLVNTTIVIHENFAVKNIFHLVQNARKYLHKESAMAVTVQQTLDGQTLDMQKDLVFRCKAVIHLSG